MNIQYYGHSCFKITTKPSGRATDEVVIFMDPFDKKIGLKPPQGKADIVFVSHNHYDHNNTDALKNNPLIVDTPGEFSIKNINVTGIEVFHDKKDGAERGLVTAFVLELEDMRICHLGDLGTELTSKQAEKINGIDILFIPIGGNYTLNGQEATKTIHKLEPKIVIPMHFKIKGTTADIEDEKGFCQEIGSCPSEKVNKINLRKKDLADKNMEVILMEI